MALGKGTRPEMMSRCQRVSGLEGSEDDLDRGLKRRQALDNCCPYGFHVNTEILMNQSVADSSDDRPGDMRVLGADGG